MQLGRKWALLSFALISVVASYPSLGQEHPVNYFLEEDQPNDFCRLAARYYLHDDWRNLQNLFAASPESRATCTTSLLANLDFIDRNPELLDKDYKIPVYIPRSSMAAPSVTSRQHDQVGVLASNEQTCAGYGFKKGTTQFGQCLMQLDAAQQQAELQQQQYQLQLAQYQQELAVYEAQQKAIKDERDRRKWAMIGRLGAGMANSTSPSFLGALNEGLAAANGVPIVRPAPVPPSPPVSQNYTIRMPNGEQVYCHYNGSHMSCR